MSILDALKKLVVKRGGTPKGSNIAEVIDDLAETSSGGGGGSNMILDLDSLPKPAIDGVEITEEFIYVLNSEDESSNERISTQYVFVHDFSEGEYPPCLKTNVKDPGVSGSQFFYASEVDVVEIRAAKTSESGTRAAPAEGVCLLNDVTAASYYVDGETFLFFPTTAQFGIRNFSVNTNPDPGGDAE